MSDIHNQTVQHHEVFGFYEGDQAAFLDHRATARVMAACEAIHTLTAVLMQREADADNSGDGTLRMNERVSMGMLSAIACCAELVNAYVAGGRPQDMGAHTYPSDSPDAELMREAARQAEARRRAGTRRTTT